MSNFGNKNFFQGIQGFKESEVPQHYYTVQKTIENAKIHGNKTKILCRNSYWRKIVHKTAQELGVPSRSIIIYGNPHVNSQIEAYRDSGCCHDCDGIGVKFTLTPKSYVELNNGYQKEIIGNSIIFDQYNQSARKDRCYPNNWGWSPDNLNYKKWDFLKKYKSKFNTVEKRIQFETNIDYLCQIHKRYGLLPNSFRKILELLLSKPMNN